MVIILKSGAKVILFRHFTKNGTGKFLSPYDFMSIFVNQYGFLSYD